MRLASFALVACLPFSLLAADISAEDLAKESEAQCAATAAQKPTPQQIVQKVDEAVALLEKEGEAAFPKFKGKASAFIFGGTYIWIHDQADCKMLMHPVKPKMVGKEYVGLKDKNGKAFFVEMSSLATTGGGWVDYFWPKPGEKEPSLKVSYIKPAKVGAKTLVVGCGVYDLTMEQVKQALGGK
jgi:cytochrome c